MFIKTGGVVGGGHAKPIKYPAHKLFGIVTRFFVSFIKVPVLLKTSDLKKTFFRLCLKLQID